MSKEEMSIRDYIMIVGKRRTTVVAIFLVFLAAVAAVTFTMTPMYKATAQIYIDTAGSAQFNLQQASGRDVNESGYLQTQINILKSDAIAKKVIQRLGLEQREAPEQKPFYDGLLKFAGISGDDSGRRETERPRWTDRRR